MRKKNKLKKKISINFVIIVFALIIALLTFGIGYSYWNTKLTISGRVRGIAEELPLEIVVSKVSNNKYVSLNFSTQELTFISDKCNENVLTTHIKAENGFNSTISTMGTSFKLANVSDYNLTDGHVELIEFRNGNGVLENPRLLISSPNVLSYGSAMVNFLADVNRVEMTGDIYCKFDIIYKENDIEKHFYYIIDITL